MAEKTASPEVDRSEEEWRNHLTDEEYRVLRERGTERKFSGKYLDETADGTFVCAGCGAELFDSDTKFKSGTGWPSFYDAIEGNVEVRTDTSHGMTRTEVICAACHGHLGHVFEDGPDPTGQRYCINSIALDFEPTDE